MRRSARRRTSVRPHRSFVQSFLSPRHHNSRVVGTVPARAWMGRRGARCDYDWRRACARTAVGRRHRARHRAKRATKSLRCIREWWRCTRRSARRSRRDDARGTRERTKRAEMTIRHRISRRATTRAAPTRPRATPPSPRSERCHPTRVSRARSRRRRVASDDEVVPTGRDDGAA